MNRARFAANTTQRISQGVDVTDEESCSAQAFSRTFELVLLHQSHRLDFDNLLLLRLSLLRRLRPVFPVHVHLVLPVLPFSDCIRVAFPQVATQEVDRFDLALLCRVGGVVGGEETVSSVSGREQCQLDGPAHAHEYQARTPLHL